MIEEIKTLARKVSLPAGSFFLEEKAFNLADALFWASIVMLAFALLGVVAWLAVYFFERLNNSDHRVLNRRIRELLESFNKEQITQAEAYAELIDILKVAIDRRFGLFCQSLTDAEISGLVSRAAIIPTNDSNFLGLLFLRVEDLRFDSDAASRTEKSIFLDDCNRVKNMLATWFTRKSKRVGADPSSESQRS